MSFQAICDDLAEFQGVLVREERVVLALRTSGNHTDTSKAMKTDFWWPGIQGDVEHLMKICPSMYTPRTVVKSQAATSATIVGEEPWAKLDIDIHQRATRLHHHTDEVLVDYHWPTVRSGKMSLYFLGVSFLFVE